MSGDGESGSSNRVPPLNLTEGERDTLLDLVCVADDMGRDDDDLQSLKEKVEDMYRSVHTAADD